MEKLHSSYVKLSIFQGKFARPRARLTQANDEQSSCPELFPLPSVSSAPNNTRPPPKDFSPSLCKQTFASQRQDGRCKSNLQMRRDGLEATSLMSERNVKYQSGISRIHTQSLRLPCSVQDRALNLYDNRGNHGGGSADRLIIEIGRFTGRSPMIYYLGS